RHRSARDIAASPHRTASSHATATPTAESAVALRSFGTLLEAGRTWRAPYFGAAFIIRMVGIELFLFHTGCIRQDLSLFVNAFHILGFVFVVEFCFLVDFLLTAILTARLGECRRQSFAGRDHL